MRRTCCVCGRDDHDVWLRPVHSPGPVVRCRGYGFVYVNPVTTTKSLIQDGPVLDGRATDLLTSANLDEIEGSWEQPIIEQYMGEFAAKQANAERALSRFDHREPTRSSLLDVGCFCGVFQCGRQERVGLLRP